MRYEKVEYRFKNGFNLMAELPVNMLEGFKIGDEIGWAKGDLSPLPAWVPGKCIMVYAGIEGQTHLLRVFKEKTDENKTSQ